MSLCKCRNFPATETFRQTMNARSLAILLAVFASLLGWAAPASAQTTTPVGPVLVYRLTFAPTGDSINFRSYQGGYYVADMANSGGNSGTLILTQVLGGARKYYTLATFGGFFYALDGGARKAVFSGSKTTTSPALSNITFFATGASTRQAEFKFINGDADLHFANKLQGVALFSDSLEDLPFVSAAGTADQGTAASMNLTLTLQEGLSERSRKDSIARNAMVTLLQNQLLDQKYSNGDAATP